jgi:pseudouridine-5'-phosphate glycosidase
MLAKFKNRRSDKSVTPQFSIRSKVSVGRIIQIIILCIFIFATGLLSGMHIGANYNVKNNDLQNQLIELRTQQTVIRGEFEAIRILYYDIRTRTELLENKNDRFIETFRRPGQAITK